MNKRNDSAIATPSKQFFVSMLTRDISLSDAILDLVDNCLDGALRSTQKSDVDYSNHSVEINLSSKEFRIKDNCGGIPLEIAKNYAFKMGRESDDDRDSNSETIGMYGVGMKRAIFKMGRDANVRSHCDEDIFKVQISSDWLDSKKWDPLPIVDLPSDKDLDDCGTIIEVSSLYPGVAKQFGNAGFINDLQTSIGEHFTMFLQKGFVIKINGIKVTHVEVEVLVSKEPKKPAPYVYQREIDNVLVSIAVGLNTGKSFDSDADELNDFERNRSSVTAGWTVFCNERAVIVGDKSRLTGWGDGIPMYHAQFSIITGIVEFRSKIADKLPITTTKRALDTSSDIWLEALAQMKIGLRVWINYTNAWKNYPRSDQTEYWETAKPLSLSDALKTVFERDIVAKEDGTREYNPKKKKILPSPPDIKPSSKRIVFSRLIEEIRIISDALFDKEDEKPGIVGDACFQKVLDDIKKQEDQK